MSEVGPSAAEMGVPPVEPPQTAGENVVHAKVPEHNEGKGGVVLGLLFMLAKEGFRPVLEAMSAMKGQQGQ